MNAPQHRLLEGWQPLAPANDRLLSWTTPFAAAAAACCSGAPTCRLPRAIRAVLGGALVGTFLTLPPLNAPAQSLWRDEVSKPMYADKRAASVGDILTIIVQENTATTKDSKTATAKQSGMDASLAAFFYSPAASSLLTKGGTLPALKYGLKNDFSGGGTVNNSEKILARAAVTVIDVLPNRNLVVEGQRETAFGGEQQTVILRGVVRPEDVLANNTVYSYNVAEARVQIISKGTLNDSQKKGWFTRIWDKINPL